MSPVKKVRVLVVDDSILFRKTLEQHLNADPRIEIVGCAADPIEAMQMIKTLNPDVVTLDVEMPKMNGIDFLKRLIPVKAVPVVVVTSLPLNALDALQAGAVDFVRKPTVRTPSDLNAFIRDLAIKIKIASTAHVGQKRVSSPVLSSVGTLLNRSSNIVIAIGASTGGTEAILSVVRNLPETTPGIVVVQHIPPVFSKMYAQRLDGICKMRVKEAENGDRVERGKIIIAAGEFHLRLMQDSQGFYVRSETGARVNGHCPSVDVLFDSVAEVAKRKALGVILTGMGGDGARGLLKMRQAGAPTIGQDKESSIVYGMPMVAFNIGAVAKQLPLDQIPSEMIRCINGMPN